MTDALVRNLIRRVRADGFGSNHGDWTAQSKIGAVAVPIVSRERVLASLNVVFLSTAALYPGLVQVHSREGKLVGVI
ncbi:DNA-binding transcriptional activator MhpR [Caballeronia hypogeia]|uniref:DNA-binding transcriptional activator MhpR n=1 Tax=Caballeronia hypogeia TaxID=1777140 RepID=A0A158DFY8_9BURK|nr:DNA-binding transcriptional activator MhpR [Caballeronia hypogeia]